MSDTAVLCDHSTVDKDMFLCYCEPGGTYHVACLTCHQVLLPDLTWGTCTTVQSLSHE